MTLTTDPSTRWDADGEPDAAPPVPAAPSRARRVLLGGPTDPVWARPALWALLVATGVALLWNLSASGYGNSFYAAAAQAGSVSWKAWFFGSLDSANSITVDKPPAALWVMGLSARMFGVNSWSLLAPQALMGVATVALVHASVVRWTTSHGAALLAGATMALTPVAALMFRFDNPDALLVLSLTAAGYALMRSLETASTRWLMAAGALVGFGFLTKMLQAVVILPVLALVYLLCAPTSLKRRLLQGLAAVAALVVSAGWYIAVVSLWPAASRPYIGGSQNNSVLELTLGYNGLGRLTGNETGSVGNQSMFSGASGPLRLFHDAMGGQISWLVPAALVATIAVVALRVRAPRTDLLRAAALLWGGTLVVTGLVFSLSRGIIHEYYTVALAPAVAVLIGLGAAATWRFRHRLLARIVAALTVLLSAWWSVTLLARTPDFHAWLRPTVWGLGLVAAAVLVAGPALLGRALLPLAALTTTAALLAGPTAYTLDTVTTAHTGSIVTAGPATAGGGQGARGGFPGGGFPGGARPQGAPPAGAPAQGFGGRPGGAGGALGGLIDAATPSTALQQLLTSDASGYTWVAAAVGAQSAAGVQLAIGQPVMAVGGFNGSDPSPTLAQFQQYVLEGKIHYFLGGSGMRANGGASDSSAIASWVAATFTAQTVGGVTVYDLSS